jgi:hypothetical protein
MMVSDGFMIFGGLNPGSYKNELGIVTAEFSLRVYWPLPWLLWRFGGNLNFNTRFTCRRNRYLARESHAVGILEG